MVERVLLGVRGATHGLWISKPGFNAETASDAQLLFTTEPGFESFQLVQTGRVQLLNNAPVNIIVPDLGYRPAVYIIPELTFSLNPSNTSLRFWTEYDSNTSLWLNILHNNLNYNGYSLYAVMKVRADGL
ncbi:hypothetical protein NA8A_04140 [Nitratireductor indicus C115]|uniref:Uncharacterized protein n=1 Tax=Nitratireductor indicus C115 TaxID=1231190 RepID=K2NXK2_9HYPH|nr:hypothetical protein [Nitratireductor indicus]EKF43970.1 hypothetical protein NA8A_04140 [Nitratireductor indicus C115]SFQ13078.1 hypothetical protein SAMN05216176_101487 [Nitratireductor indicus]